MSAVEAANYKADARHEMVPLLQPLVFRRTDSAAGRGLTPAAPRVVQCCCSTITRHISYFKDPALTRPLLHSPTGTGRAAAIRPHPCWKTSRSQAGVACGPHEHSYCQANKPSQLSLRSKLAALKVTVVGVPNSVLTQHTCLLQPGRRDWRTTVSSANARSCVVGRLEGAQPCAVLASQSQLTSLRLYLAGYATSC